MKAYFAAMAAFIATCSSAQVTNNPPPVWLSWKTCIRDNALKFSKGSDAANLVAVAAVNKCKPLLDEFLDGGSDPTPDPQKAGELLRIKDALRDGYLHRAMDEATLVVIEARSN